MSLDALAEGVAKHVESDLPDEEHRYRVRIALHQIHLPKLKSYGLVRYDTETKQAKHHRRVESGTAGSHRVVRNDRLNPDRFEQGYPRSAPIETTTVSPHRPSQSNADSRRKAVLFCPDCSHESDIDGDWNVHADGDQHIYECPDCEATVTKRPRAAPALTP